MKSWTRSAEGHLAADAGLSPAPAASDDPFAALDDLMAVVEALCPVWPARGRFATVRAMLARTTSGLLALSLLLALAGCGDDDDASSPGLDAGTEDAGTDAGPRAPDVCDDLRDAARRGTRGFGRSIR